MKRLFIIFLIIFCVENLFAEDNKDVLTWNKKTNAEKICYVEGMIDCMKYLSQDIDKQLSKEERKENITSKTANQIEIPVLYAMFVVGNVQTNGIQSIVPYIDECYSQNIYKTYSIYELLVLAAKGNLMQNPKFQWMFE